MEIAIFKPLLEYGVLGVLGFAMIRMAFAKVDTILQGQNQLGTKFSDSFHSLVVEMAKNNLVITQLASEVRDYILREKRRREKEDKE